MTDRLPWGCLPLSKSYLCDNVVGSDVWPRFARTDQATTTYTYTQPHILIKYRKEK